uniref:Uncharacterized protein n=1 Tax=Aegilops tauschii TaxID=37682 RepID=M8BUZ2_AEGTA
MAPTPSFLFGAAPAATACAAAASTAVATSTPPPPPPCLEAVAANLQAQGNSVVLQHHHDYLPAFDAATGSRYYSPLLVPAAARPSGAAAAGSRRRPLRPGRGARAAVLHGPLGPHGGVRPGGPWPPAAAPGAGARAPFMPKHHLASGVLLRLLPPRGPTLRPLLQDRGTRAPAAGTTDAPYYSIYDLAATLTAARKETAGEGFLVAAEGRKEVREIEFFPTRVTSHGGPDEAELRRTPPSSSSPSGAVGGSLDLSLRL